MLVLSRKKGESIRINHDIEVKILSVDGEYVKIGITAPKDVKVFRQEVYESIQLANQQAIANKVSIKEIENLLKNTQKGG
jgi:carbon storage regulator